MRLTRAEENEMMEQVDKILVKGTETYKGWKCIEIGFGSAVMKKGEEVLTAVTPFRPIGGISWVVECWIELKEKIDLFETYNKMK